MEKEERFLPIGTVVLLKGGKRELMIISYCITPTGSVYDKDGKVDDNNIMFDYGACLYPEGMIKSDQLFAFNHDQIDRICHMGYVTESQTAMSQLLNNGIEKKEKDAKREGQE